MQNKIVLGLLTGSLVMLILSFCSSIQTPDFNVNPKINKSKSLLSIKDSLLFTKQIPCTLHVSYAHYIKWYSVRLSSSIFKDSLIDSGAVTDSIITFTLPVYGPDTFRLNAKIGRPLSTDDSLSVKFTAYTVPPQLNKVKSLASVKDSMLFTKQISCTLSILKAGFLKWYCVRLSSTLFYDSLIDSAAAADSIIPFMVPLYNPDTFRLKVTIGRQKSADDSMRVKFTVYSFHPQVSADAQKYFIHLRDSVKMKFYIFDPDSNLYSAYLRITPPDTTIEHLIAVTKRLRDTIRYTYTATAGTAISFSAVARDEHGGTASAQCTVVIYDTTKPSITLLEPQDTTLPVLTLPLTISTRVADYAPIDSVIFRNNSGTIRSYMNILHDTALVKQSELDSGKHTYFISAWDRYHNVNTLTLTLDYEGKKTYPPQIIRIIKDTINENGMFDTIRLDSTLVKITDPAATYPVDSLKWDFSVTGTYPKLTPLYNPVKRSVTIYKAPADSEWSGSEQMIFTVHDPKGLFDSKIMTFTILAVNDKPRITVAEKRFRAVLDTLWLDTCARDPDNKSSTLQWVFLNGRFLKIVNISQTGIPDQINPFKQRRVVAIPISPKIIAGTDTLMFIVSDGQLKDSAHVYFTYKPLDSRSIAPFYKNRVHN